MPFEELFVDNPPGVAESLMRATVGIAGAGGLGSNIAIALSRAGIGRLIVADFDIVETRNLNRQSYFIDQIGMLKIDALRDTLGRINPELRFVGIGARLDRRTCLDCFGEADVLVEAFDQAESKQFLLEEWLTLLPGRPVVAASGLAGSGGTDRLRVFRAGTLTVCGDFESDASEGTLSARVGIVASMMANEVISILVDGIPRMEGRR
jgi:sulfur carrier protein ThiS adenylyltransferase